MRRRKKLRMKDIVLTRILGIVIIILGAFVVKNEMKIQKRQEYLKELTERTLEEKEAFDRMKRRSECFKKYPTASVHGACSDVE